MEKFEEQAKSCGYLGYIEEHVQYPPQGLLPLPGNNATAAEGCTIWNDIFEAALIVNPAFNIYRISDVYPILVSMHVLELRPQC